jgi:hypothetical protein
MKWLIGVLFLFGCTLVIASWLWGCKAKEERSAWDESWRQVLIFNTCVPEELVFKEKSHRVSLAIPNDRHWEQVAERMKSPRFFVTRFRSEGHQFKPVPVRPLEPLDVSVTVNNLPQTPKVNLAYIQLGERQSRIPLWGLEVPIRLGDRIDVTLAAPADSPPQEGTILLTPYFFLDKDHSVGFDRALDDMFIEVVRLTGLGCAGFAALLLGLCLARRKA